MPRLGKALTKAVMHAPAPLPPTVDRKTAALRAKREAAAKHAPGSEQGVLPALPARQDAPLPQPKGMRAALHVPPAEKAPRVPMSEVRIVELLDELRQQRDVLAQARMYAAVLAETGWPAVEIARRMHSEKSEINRRWNDVIEHINVLALEPEYQAAVAAGELTVMAAYELFRVQPTHRPTLFAAFRAGKGRRAVRQLARQLARAA
jgi:hypothetical protein